ncbi:hypothetical protein [Ellagibacter isourolithinifaciens]|uniref:hypothetical protein n=1 Tax=Ellagibacter isourolithinifaciens TaxID=2137581 RepID=UPI003A8F083D
MTPEEEYDRMVEHLKSACATCVYGFFAAIGYSCGITRKVTSHVVSECGAYRKRRVCGGVPHAERRD